MALDVELAEIRDFLARHAPFDTLPAEVLGRLPRGMVIKYYRRGRAIIARGRDNHCLYVVRSGAVDIRDQHGTLVDRGEVGTVFGSLTLVLGNPSTRLTKIARETPSLTGLVRRRIVGPVRCHRGACRFPSGKGARYGEPRTANNS